jgi:hypothetical protein
MHPTECVSRPTWPLGSKTLIDVGSMAAHLAAMFLLAKRLTRLVNQAGLFSIVNCVFTQASNGTGVHPDAPFPSGRAS